MRRSDQLTENLNTNLQAQIKKESLFKATFICYYF